MAVIANETYFHDSRYKAEAEGRDGRRGEGELAHGALRTTGERG